VATASPFVPTAVVSRCSNSPLILFLPDLHSIVSHWPVPHIGLTNRQRLRIWCLNDLNS
jgi:hypothetical protein